MITGSYRERWWRRGGGPTYYSVPTSTILSIRWYYW